MDLELFERLAGENGPADAGHARFDLVEADDAGLRARCGEKTQNQGGGSQKALAHASIRRGVTCPVIRGSTQVSQAPPSHDAASARRAARRFRILRGPNPLFAAAHQGLLPFDVQMRSAAVAYVWWYWRPTREAARSV